MDRIHCAATPPSAPLPWSHRLSLAPYALTVATLPKASDEVFGALVEGLLLLGAVNGI
jgi:hypothetical protein